MIFNDYTTNLEIFGQMVIYNLHPLEMGLFVSTVIIFTETAKHTPYPSYYEITLTESLRST
jgi:hypothetical protein